MSSVPLRIATRASRLALWQANHVRELLVQAAADVPVELVEVSTTGDQDQSQSLNKFGGVGVFTREVQRAVLDGRADLAVHSLKDLPTQTAEGLVLAGVPARGPRYDRLVFPAGSTANGQVESLSQQSRVGTGSPRRRAQLLHARQDLRLLDIRGNVETRLRKLDEGQFDALVLAEAGLERLALLDGRMTGLLSPPLMYPAVGQGALGIECRVEDSRARTLLTAISDETIRQAITAERALLAELQAGCHAPVGVQAEIEESTLRLEAVVLSADGRTRLCESAIGGINDPAAVARDLADNLRNQGADELIQPV